MSQKLFRRPSSKASGKPLPTKYRFTQAGVLMFQPTLADRAKIALGFGIRLRVEQVFQHNPGQIEVSARWDLVENRAGKDTPQIKPIADKSGGGA